MHHKFEKLNTDVDEIEPINFDRFFDNTKYNYDVSVKEIKKKSTIIRVSYLEKFKKIFQNYLSLFMDTDAKNKSKIKFSIMGLTIFSCLMIKI